MARTCTCHGCKGSTPGAETDEWGREKHFTALSCARPWFRGFHFSWVSFFLAFIGWFSIVPAMEYIVEDPTNGIDFQAAQTSAIISVLGTVFLRLAIGPLCERFGPKVLQCFLLVCGGCFVLGSSAIVSTTGLYVTRFLIGFIGAAFVPCQYWTTMMFADEVVGQANAFAGGWGNLGAGFANLFVAALIAWFQQLGLSDDSSWRLAVVIPGVVLLVFPIFMYTLSDECPQGAWHKRIYNNAAAQPLIAEKTIAESGENAKMKVEVEAKQEQSPWIDWRVWLLFAQYACCFGVELAINNSMTSYLFRNFLYDTGNCTTAESFDSESDFLNACSILGKNGASLVASLFGLMNLFARALGGLASDRANRRLAMRGRLLVQFLCLFMEGTVLIIFSRVTSLPVAIFVLIVFSVFVQASEGSSFAIVPFMSQNIGVVAGIVGAGGNVGAVCWSTMIRAVSSTADAYLYLGVIVILSSLFTMVFPVQNQFLLFPSTHTAKMQAKARSNGVSDAFTNGVGVDAKPVSSYAEAENKEGGGAPTDTTLEIS